MSYCNKGYVKEFEKCKNGGDEKNFMMTVFPELILFHV